MSRHFDATDEFAVDTTQAMRVPPHATTVALLRGRMKAHVTVWEPEDNADASLPTVHEFLDRYVDSDRRLLSYEWQGLRLTIDAAPLLALAGIQREYRVSPGASFVSDEARDHGSGLASRKTSASSGSSTA